MVERELRGDPPPGVPVLGPAVQEHNRTSRTGFRDVKREPAHVDVAVCHAIDVGHLILH
jgi:hypothetical protein